MDHYKSWSGLNKWLRQNLCEAPQGRITFFLTRYHKVHDSYGRGAILLDGKEWAGFSWIEMYRQEQAVSVSYAQDSSKDWMAHYDAWKPVWDENCTWCEMDFLQAVLEFRNMPIEAALDSENYIIKILAILDKRVGKRTLQRIKEAGEYKSYPQWVKQFFELRFGL